MRIQTLNTQNDEYFANSVEDMKMKMCGMFIALINFAINL